jgi:hypothetical protein
LTLPLDRQIEIITNYKREIHETAEELAPVIQAVYSRMENEGPNFRLTDEEMLRVSNVVGKINTILSSLTIFASTNTKSVILRIMEVGSTAYFSLRTPQRNEAIGILDAYLKIAQSIIPETIKPPIRAKMSAELNLLFAKIKALLEQGYPQ